MYELDNSSWKSTILQEEHPGDWAWVQMMHAAQHTHGKLLNRERGKHAEKDIVLHIFGVLIYVYMG